MTATLEHLDPTTLLIDTNVRSDLGLTKDFIASVKTCGVIVPIVAERTEQGVRVRAGHRRTAAAVEVGLATVPVMVIDGGDTAGRIIDQLVENTHRAGLTPSDTVAAVEQLALLGASAATITKRTRLPRTTVDQALLVSEASSTRTTIATSEGLTLEMAAWLAEFEDDPATWERLRRDFTKNPGLARHDVERARKLRADRAAMTAVEAQLTALGATRYEGNVWEDKKAKYLADLVDPDGQQISVEDHQNCPGHAYDLRTYPSASAYTEFTHQGVTVYACWLCTDYPTHGHRDRYKAATGAPDPSADEQREQRRQTIALNQAGAAAKDVRVEWLTAFTQDRSAPPKDWTMFMLDSLHNDHVASEDRHTGWQHVKQLLNLTDATLDDLQDPTRAARWLLCARLWTYEARATKEIWRQTTHRLYLAYLEAWGYTLSDAEKAGAGHITTQDAYTRLTQDQP